MLFGRVLACWNNKYYLFCFFMKVTLASFLIAWLLCSFHILNLSQRLTNEKLYAADNYLKMCRYYCASGNLHVSATLFSSGCSFILGRNMDKLVSFSEDIASNIPICSVDMN